MELCAFLYPSGIPRTWLDDWTNDEDTSDEILSFLQRHQLWRFDKERRTFSVHRLLQQVIQDRLKESNPISFNKTFYFLKYLSEKARDSNEISWGEISKSLTDDWPIQVSHLFDQTELINEISEKDQIQLLLNTVNYIHYTGRPNKFLIYFLKLGLSISQRTHDQQRQIEFHTYLGAVYMQTGNSEALNHFSESLKIGIDFFGKESIQTAHLNIVLFISRYEAIIKIKKTVKEKKELTQQLLEITNNYIDIFRLKINSPQHLIFLCGIKAKLQSHLIKWEEDKLKKRALYEEILHSFNNLLKITKKINPSNTLLIATMHSTIGMALIELELYLEGIDNLKKAISIFNETNSTSIHALQFKRNLGRGYYFYAVSLKSKEEKDRFFAKAIKSYLSILPILYNQFGRNHPTTALYHFELGAIYSDQGDLASAQKHFIEFVEIYNNLNLPEEQNLLKKYDNLMNASKRKELD